MPPGTQICDSAPAMRKQIGAVALSVNLLLTTLAVFLMAREPMHFRPQQKYAVTAELPVRAGALGIPPPPTTRDAIHSPFQRKFQVIADQFVNIGLLGYPAVSPAWIDFDTDPPRKFEVIAEQQINRLPLLGAPLVIAYPREALYTNRQQKYEVTAEGPVRPPTLGIPTPPPTVFYPREAVLTNLQPKYAVTAESPVRATGLPIPAPLGPPLPLGLEFQYAQLQTKSAVENDFFTNVLILGIPVGPTPPPPVGAASAEPGRRLHPGRTRLARIRQESEAEKLERRIEQGIVLRPAAEKPANIEKLERDIARYQAKITEYKAKALALERAAAADKEAKHLRAQIDAITAQQDKAEREIEEAEIADLKYILSRL